MKKKIKLIEYRNNVYSQNGEDGVLEEIFKRINVASSNNEKWCVEFGAWDGKHLSNTFHLVEQGWNAVYIEGDIEKYQDLLETVKQYPKIKPINAMVGFEESDSNNLNNLLIGTKIPEDFDLLSIDIDSFDLAVWQCFVGQPKVVIIEINSSIEPGILQWHDGIFCQGNSFSSTIKVAEDEGYMLVCHTGNLIFLREDLVQMIGIDNRSIHFPETLFLNNLLSSKKNNSDNTTFFKRLKTKLKDLI